MVSNTYLVQALRAFRMKTYGQFDQVTEHKVQVTQDAAEEIERLNARIAELEKGVTASLDGKNTTCGHVGGMSWEGVASLIEAEDKDSAHLRLVTIIAKPRGLETVWERRE